MHVKLELYQSIIEFLVTPFLFWNKALVRKVVIFFAMLTFVKELILGCAKILP